MVYCFCTFWRRLFDGFGQTIKFDCDVASKTKVLAKVLPRARVNHHEGWFPQIE